MTLKLFRAAWFVSALLVLANLLYVYASLPEAVVIHENEHIAVGREWFFYGSLLALIAINLLVYLFKLLYEQGENLRAWFHGFIITVNIFLIIAMQAVNVYNSNEMFNHRLVSVYVTGSLALIVIWAAVWPVYLMVQRFFIKQAV